MGAELSTVSHAESNNNDVNQPTSTMKPNKVKKNNYFHSKPSHLVDLIVNKDWQSVINRCTSHPKDIFVTQKIRLYGVDRKILPLHIACAMRPPVEIISMLLKPDQVNNMSTVKTPMKNAKKKTLRKSDKKGKSVEAVPTMSYPQQLILGSVSESVSASDKDSTTHDAPETCKTVPLSPPNGNDEDIMQSTSHSSLHDDASNFFFPDPDKENHYALQITPSGEVKQISPNGKSSRSRLASESPFVHASASHSEDPPSLQSAMADDFLPVHIACLFRSSPEVIELLIKCYPEGLELKNKWGMLPIHIVCSNLSLEPPNITAGKLADHFTTKDFLNNLYSESMDEDKWEMTRVVEMLVASCPQCVNMPSDNIEWYTPLEYATRNLPRDDDASREEIMKLLKKKNQVSVGGISCDGHSISSSLSDSKASSDIKAFPISNCPLLYSYISTKQWERSKDRVAKSSEEASCWVVDTDYPRLPIHLACSFADAPRDLIQALLDAYPEGCMAKEGSGSNPLHLACKNGLQLETITTLLEKYPKVTRIKDEIGRLPLHLSCAIGAELSVVKVLMDAYPASCSMKDYNGHTALTYVDYCTDDDAVKDDFTALFEQYEDKLKRREKVEVEDEKTIEEEGDGEYRQLQVD
jgi:hypothetical protein